MPYFITDKSPDCSGWATVKEDGEVIGCHTTKQDAIDQMVAVSIAEDMEPGGERALPDNYRPALSSDVPEGRACGNCHYYNEDMIQEDGKELKAYCMKWDAYVLGGWYCNAWESEDMSLDEERNSDADEVIIVDIDGTLIAGGRGIQKNVDYVNSLYSDYYIYIVTGRPESDEEKTLQELSDAGVQFNDIQFNEDMSIDTPEYKKQTAADILEENPVKLAIDNDAAARSAYASLGIATKDPKTIKADEAPSIRQVSLDVPTYIRTAARKGLDYYGQGLAGDGLVDRTVREARDMARGEVTEDKVIRTNAWGARHLVDLDAPKNSDPDDKEFPGAGAVAFYLWGINPLNPKPAMDWFMGKAEAIKAERADAPAPPKDQITGSDKNPVGSAKAPAGSKTIELSAAIEAGLKNKAKEHNDAVGDNPGKRATVGMLRTVFRRGAGAYSTSHRPGITRDQWSYARVNAFLYLLRNGRPENAKYIGDNDLLPKGHPKSSRSLGSFGTSIGDMDSTVETRRITSNEFELRADPQGNGMSFTGYAAVFNSPSEPLPFIERIMPGAFSKSLKSKNNVRMYMNHDSSMLLATTRAKTLRLSEDSKGLFVDASLPDTTIGRDLSVLMQRGDVNSMSFGFTVPSGGDMWSDDGQSRELRQIKLYEVSVVTGFPAYTATTAAVRSLDALAIRTGIDADQLAAAITNLESGQTLSNDHAMLLRETVAKLEPVQDTAPARLGVMAKHLDLLKTIA